MQLLATLIFDSLSYASWLFIVALGLTLAFGVLKILNIALVPILLTALALGAVVVKRRRKARA